jgi:hypothetical protein
MKIAIVGNGILTRNHAPFNDPEWQVWGLSGRIFEYQQKYGFTQGFDVLWECHNRDWDADYFSFMENNCVKLPRGCYKFIEPNEGFKSSLAYMIVEAILLEPDEIALYGFDCNVIEKEEYGDQIPNIKYFMGLAAGKGIKVSAPPQCQLFETSMYGKSPDVSEEQNVKTD